MLELILGVALLSSPAQSTGPVESTKKSSAAADLAAQRNPLWAKPLQGPGLDNFYQVSATLYRGEQPTKQGFQELARLGVKTVVSLRAYHGERETVTRAGLGYERISFKVWHPEDEDMRRFLAIVSDPARQPVFLHCKRGADRTGTAVAVYRICVEGWSREAAIDEMKNGGYRFNPRFTHLEDYLRSFDAPALKAGLPKPAVSN